MAEGEATGSSNRRPPFKPPRRIPPPTHRALQQVVNRYAAYHGIAPNRVQRWISFTVLGAALSRIEQAETGPLFLVKGGVALEVRLRMRARATKDFDAVYRGKRDNALQTLAAAFTEEYEGFAFRVDDVREMLQVTRIEIKIDYQGKTWSSITMEISLDEGTALPAEHIPAIDLVDFGLKGPATLPCLPLTKQVAQKLHAMTETIEGRPNDRFRDLVDLWVLRELVPPTVELRKMCEETFRIRKKHDWPPEVVVYEHWRKPFAEQSRVLELPITDADTAATDVRAYILAIAES